MIINKEWGTVERIDRTNETTIDKLVISPSCMCSLHRHARSANCFYVTKGVLYVRYYSVSYVACYGSTNGLARQTNLLERHELKAGDSLVVMPGVWHEFLACNSGAEAIEVAYKQAVEDIERA